MSTRFRLWPFPPCSRGQPLESVVEWEEVSVEEITEETAELVARVAGLDIGKASLVCCVRVPHDGLPGRRRQQVRTFATTTGQLLELRDWLAAEGVTGA